MVFMDAGLEIVLAEDPAYWADFSDIVLANGEIFSFKKRTYQIKPMKSRARKICVRKATGMGFSEMFILRSLHGCIYRRYKQGVGYIFPNADEMMKFSKSRFAPLIQANRGTIGKYVKSGGKGTDTANFKRVGGANLFMDGGMMTQTVGENILQKESAALRGKQFDCGIADELDLMDMDILQKIEGRMGNSELKELVCISNPTIPNYGVDSLFQKSSYNLWFRKCEHCGEWTCSDEHFPDLVGIDEKGKGYCACKKCGKPLGYEGEAEWVAKYPDNKEWEGYHISQLNSSTNDPYEILSQFRNPPNGNIADVYKLRLGLPYISKEDQLTVQDVMACCGRSLMSAGHPGPCAMGVDVGKTFHVVIGVRIDRDRYELVKTARLPSFDDVGLLARRFGVRSAVIDIRPYEDSARKFQKEAGIPKVYLCEYTTNPMQEAFWNNNELTVKAYRTGIFDATHRLIAEKKIVIPMRSPEIDEFARQVCATAKVLETSGKNKAQVYNYIKLGDEHYRNALNYFLLAAGGNRVAKFSSSGLTNRQKYAIHNTVKI